MFIEEIGEKELFGFIKKIGFEPKQGTREVRLNKNGDSVVLISCEPQEYEKALYKKISNSFFSGGFLEKSPYCLGATLALTDFDCYNVLHPEEEYYEDWQLFMHEKFGEKYVEALDAAIEKQKQRNNDNQEK